ncbi:MAG: hypothetical protein IT422_06570, partial [Pirellulaceae bacterium]|nr:hypothetical protein [Pirellulaceae bacterium]
TEYLQQSLKGGERGYMVDVARVYLADRFPPPADSPAEPPTEQSAKHRAEN